MSTRNPSGPRAERQRLRAMGQFWTPAWVARTMVRYVLMDRPKALFDPAVGNGAFFLAAKTIGSDCGQEVHFCGVELDASALDVARSSGLSSGELDAVVLGDFLSVPASPSHEAIVANPPYIRHHRLSSTQKARLRRMATKLLGSPLDGRAGLHVYFLLHALTMLKEGGRLAFIIPSDTCEGVFATELWAWVTRRYCLEAVVIFAEDATPFPGVDVNPLVVFLRKAAPRPLVNWARCLQRGAQALEEWVASGFELEGGPGLQVVRVHLTDVLRAGLSRDPASCPSSEYVLGDFAAVVRGIATGANSFFLMTPAAASARGIPSEFLRPAVARTRDVPTDRIDGPLLAALAARGRPTLLLCPDGRPLEEFPPALARYLREGEALGLPSRPLLQTRSPWYRMEVRDPPPLLFAYLGRRHLRFIRNDAAALPLTGFLCVYPVCRDTPFVDALWGVLGHPATLAGLRYVGKSYGDGAVKVEPRALEKLSISGALERQIRVLLDHAPRQSLLFACREDAERYESGKRRS